MEFNPGNMTDRADPPPPYSEAIYSAQYGGNVWSSQGYPPQSGDYPPGGYIPKAEPYPSQPGYSQPQSGYGQPQFCQPQYTQAYTGQTAVIVSQPGGPGHTFVHSRPPDYMAASIFACLCCFWPTGLCAIYFASQANKLASMGDMLGARQMSNNARNLMISSIVIGIIWITLVIVLRVAVYSSYYSNY